MQHNSTAYAAYAAYDMPGDLAERLEPVTLYCVCRIGVRDCVFEIRQLLVGDILLSPEYRRDTY